MKPQITRRLKATVLVLLSLALSGIRSPILAYTTLYATTHQMPQRLPVITAKNAALLTRFATISPPTPDDSLEVPLWSPDGKYLAVSGLRAILLYDVSNLAAKPRLIYQAAPTITFSPDGALLAAVTYVQDRSVRVYEVKSGRQLYVVHYLGGVRIGGPVDPTFSPDSSLLTVSNRSQIYVLDARTGKIMTVLPGSQYNLSFSPDSTVIAAVESEAYQEAIVISEARTGERLTGFRINTLSAAIVAFSPSGSTIAVGFRGNDIVVFDIATGEELNRLSPGYQDTANLSFSPDGTMLAAFGPGKSFLWDLTTGHHTEFDYSDYDRYGGAFNKDGSLLLYWDYNENQDLPYGNLLRIWSIPEHRQLRWLEGARDPQFSPDGTMLATWGESGVVVWAVQQSNAEF